MDSGNYWIEETKRIDVLFNSSQDEFEVFSSAGFIITDTFNISGGNATILLIADENNLLANLTDVTGVFDPEINTTEILGYPPFFYRFIITASAGVRVILDYIERGQIFWDGVPYRVYTPEYYVFASLGLAFFWLCGLLLSFGIVNFLNIPKSSKISVFLTQWTSWLEDTIRSRFSRDSITSITALTMIIGGIISLIYAVILSWSFGFEYVTIIVPGGLLAMFAIPGGVAIWQNKWYTSTKSEVIGSIVYCAWGLLMYATDVMLYGNYLLLIPFPLVFIAIIVVSTIHLALNPLPQEPEPPMPERNRSVSEMYEGAED